jgi:biopolymer transport protein ExbB/TolQ
MILWHQFQEGGWAMWLILFWLVCSVVVFAERALYLFSAHQEVSIFTATISKLVSSRDWSRAIVMCAAAKTPLGRITKAGLERASSGPEAFEKGLAEAALRELPAISRNIGYMALFSNLAMLCGLFGTILGLIGSFGSVASESVDTTQKARILAAGIAEAMNCTAFGLLTAIVALVGYALLSSWAQEIEDDIHAETSKIFNAVLKQLRPEDEQSSPHGRQTG